jgi:uncharacterized membrane protein (DUF485 family)
MAHGPSTQWGEDKASEYKSKLGVYLFIFYTLVYAGFIVINVVSPKSMGVIVFSGLNLACVYGFGLIILAITMGLIYNYMCSQQEYKMNK